MDRSSSVFLTKREVDAAEARDERYHLWDTKLVGFGLRVERAAPRHLWPAIEPTAEGVPPRGAL